MKFDFSKATVTYSKYGIEAVFPDGFNQIATRHELEAYQTFLQSKKAELQAELDYLKTLFVAMKAATKEDKGLLRKQHQLHLAMGAP